MALLSIPLLTLVLLSGSARQAPVPDVQAERPSADVEALVMEARTGTERYVFRLQAARVDDSGEPATEADPSKEGVEPLGWARLSKTTPDRHGSTRTTLELAFTGGGAERTPRLIHGETVSKGERILSWRELDGPSGRSLFLRARGERVVVRDFAIDGAERRVDRIGALDRLPLELVYRALGTVGTIEADRFDPLSRSWKRVRASSKPLAPGFGASLAFASHLRVVRIEEHSGRACHWLFLGAQPLAFELAPGGPVAMRVEGTRFPTRWLAQDTSATRD